ncbi:MAG: hypothetical protein HC815_06005 [Richelia sp. RM1_1_1]|nr:hypothetical protein [Richelia sp. RM1_1_1]
MNKIEISKEIAEIILQQLGGKGKLVMMIGVWNIKVEDNSVSFRFKGSQVANYIKIILDASDTYNLEFMLINSAKGICEEKEKYSMIYADMLISTFEEYTGLYLSF